MEEMVREMHDMFLATMLKQLIRDGKLDEFLEFAREQAKKDGMDTETLMRFFDELEENFCDNIDWEKALDIIQKVTGCNAMGFKGDKSIIIENQEMDDDECKDYLQREAKGKINLEHINQALKIVDVKLEFIEAMNIPFDVGGFENFCRFKVVEIDK